MEDCYVIETGLEDEELSKTQVLIFEPVVTNLDEIIRYRRENRAPWTVGEFNCLVRDTVNALEKMHSNHISHNDIRPCHIYYSIAKKCYMLGSFANSLQFNSNSHSVRLQISKAF